MPERRFSGEKRPKIRPYDVRSLGDQLSHVQEEGVGEAPEEREERMLVPGSVTREEILSMPLAEIKKRFAVRYELYVKMLRGLEWLKRRKAEGMDVTAVIPPNIDPGDIARLQRWLAGLNGLDKYIRSHEEGKVTLKEQQFNVFQDIRKEVEAGVREGYIVLPTGVGKTAIFVELAEAFNSRTVVVVPSIDLVGQVRGEFAKFAPNMRVGAVYTNEKVTSEQVTITTYASLSKLIDEHGIDPKQIDLLILDEAHRGLSESRQNEVKRFSSSIILGLTATPEFAEDKKLSDLLPNEIHRMGIREAVELGLLSNVMAALVKTDVDLSGVPVIGGGYKPSELEKKMNNEVLTRAVVDLYKKRHAGQKALIFCCGVQHAKDVAKAFVAAGIKAAEVDGEVLPKRRDVFYKEMQSGDLMVLTNALLLKEGVNIPKATVCFNLQPTESAVHQTQRSGRVTRLDNEDPQKLAVVYDFLPKPDKRVAMVLFSSVLDGSLVLQQHAAKWDREGPPPPPPVPPEPIELPDVEVTYDINEVIRITKEYSEGVKEVTQEEIRKALTEQGVTAKNWLDKSYEEKKKITVNGLGLYALGTLFLINGGPIDNSSSFLDLCNRIFGAEQVAQAEGEIRQEELQRIRSTLNEKGVSAKTWVGLKRLEKEKIKVNGLGLVAIASLFGVRGNPNSLNDAFLDLCRAIFGNEEVNQALQEMEKSNESEKNLHRQLIKEQVKTEGVLAIDWIKKSREERVQIKVLGKGLLALGTLFGVRGNPNSLNDAFLDLCRAIFGNEEVNQALSSRPELEKQEILVAAEIQKTSLKNWIKRPLSELEKFTISNKGVHTLAKIFDVTPLDKKEDYFLLFRKIFGDEEVDRDLQELQEETENDILEEVDRTGIKAIMWVDKTEDERKLIELRGKKLNAIARVFGIQGSPFSRKDVYLDLCRAIFGDKEVDKAIVELKILKREKVRSSLRKMGVGAKEWVRIPQTKRRVVEVENIKLTGIAAIFGIDGNPLSRNDVYLDLCRAVFGNQEVDKALKEPEK